ncbi:MAG: sensor histidine kinase, partial [Chloroflexota bacterium]|nr:sensor histidine kinase [Chloroflexota bacterium]
QGNIILHPSGLPYKEDEHADNIAPLVTRREPGTRIHDPPEGKKHVVAYYPLESVGGGVLVEQSTDKALAIPNSMQRTMLYFGFGALLVASIAAWLHARSVVRPIRELTGASSRIAAGALDTPVVSRREDEVGELARSFESMRVQLKAHLEERQRWGEELEGRVRERTQEVNWLLGKVISAQEEERKRIARELHDETAQALAALLVGIQTADEALPPAAAEAKAALDRIKPQATRALEEMRNMILELRPSALDDLGLASAIRWYAENSLEPRGVAVTCKVTGKEKRLPGPLETALFRMAQEAINNVAKHAEARNAQLQLRFANRKFVIDVEDDGRGFDVQGVAASTDETRGLGLLGMKERAALFRGSVHVESKLGRGTRVHIEVPVEDGENTDTAGR